VCAGGDSVQGISVLTRCWRQLGWWEREVGVGNVTLEVGTEVSVGDGESRGCHGMVTNLMEPVAKLMDNGRLRNERGTGPQSELQVDHWSSQFQL
jgi:hypothetical protein